MYHELLLAMSGYPGDVFIEVDGVDGVDGGGIFVSEDLPFLTESERAILNELCSLGHMVRSLEAFSTRCESVSRPRVTALVHGQYAKAAAMKDDSGLYLRAFANGLERVLTPYHALIVDTEQDVIADPALPVTHLLHKFREFKLLLPALMALVATIDAKKIRGCALLELIHQRSMCGIPNVQSAMSEWVDVGFCLQDARALLLSLHVPTNRSSVTLRWNGLSTLECTRLLRTCHGVLYRQLSAWVVYGVLLDANDEFFIRRQSPLSNASDQTKLQESHGEDASSTSWLGAFSLRLDMLPSYIPLRVAGKILFVGKAIQLVSPSSPSRDKEGAALNSKASVSADEEKMFLSLIADLNNRADFDATAFETAVDQIRDAVARHLWQLMMTEADLMGHIRAVKDYFLLGKGEAYMAFFDLGRKLLAMPPTNTFESDLNSLFQSAIASVSTGHADEDNARAFRLVLEKDEDFPSDKDARAKQGRTQADLWPRIGMEYNVRWPLDLFFTPDLVKRYNGLFRFLLVAKRTQIRLQSLWMHQMRLEGRGGRSNDGEPTPDELGLASTLTAAWRLRNSMSFLVDNIQYYLQVDVLEVQHAQLEQSIEKTRDFESMLKSHESYVNALMSQCFLLSKPVSRLLHEVFDLCHSLCDAYLSASTHLDDLHRYREQREARERQRSKARTSHQQQQQAQPPAALEPPTPSPALPTPLDRASLASLQKTFDRQVGFLLRMLSGVRGAQYSPHLAQLLLRLDFNGYYAGLLSSVGGQAQPSHSHAVDVGARAAMAVASVGASVSDASAYGGMSAMQQQMLAALEPSRIDK